MGVLDNIFKRNNVSDNDEVKSESVEADVFDNLKYIDTLCNTSLNLHKSKLEEERRLLKNIELLDQLNKYEEIDSNDIMEIEDLIDKYTTLGREKESLKSDLLLNERKYEAFRKYEDTIEESITELRNMEDNKEKLDVDLKYLKAEQGALKFEEENILEKYKRIESLFYTILLFACIGIVAFSGMYFIFGNSIILPCTVIAVVVIFWIMWIFMIESDLKLGLEKNKFKQEKIVKMINKIKIKIVNAEADLITQYKKYDVNSAASLKNKWAIYRQTKNKRMQYNEVFTDYFDIYERIEKILNKYHIQFDDELSVLKELTDKKEKLKLKSETETDIIASKKRIEKFVSEQKEIVEKLKMMREDEKDEESAICKVIDTFFEQFDSQGML